MHATHELGEVDPFLAHFQAARFRDAIAELANSHAPAIGRLAMALLGSQSEADEATQDTFLAAFGALPSYRGDGTPRAWLYSIARRVCAQRLEARTREQRHLRLVQNVEAATAVDARVDAIRRAARMREALAQVKPSEREALLLRYESDLSYAEIGYACGIDEATARKRVSRGLERLRSTLRSEDES